MKKIKMMIVLLLTVLMIPAMVKAEDTDPEVIATNNEPVNVYIFRSDTCGYCKALMEWINSDEIQEKYGQYFKVVDYEVSSNEENAKLMLKAKGYFNDKEEGVPYIVVGKNNYPNGFASDVQVDDKGTTMGEQLISQIIEEYEKAPEERFDILKELETTKEKDNSLTVGIISGVVILVMIGGIIVARKNS